MLNLGAAKDMHRLREFMQVSSVALLTTTDEHGIMHARPVDTPELDSDGSVWFISSAIDPLLEEVGARREVQLTYVDDRSGRCMVVMGTARVLRDAARAAALWRPALASWFPQGPADPELTVVNVSVTSADLWD